MAASEPPVLDLQGLSIRLIAGPPIVEDVSLQLRAGEILGIVGESGSGKTTTALALLGYSGPGTVIAAGELRLGGQSFPMDQTMRSIRGSTISYVPQDPGRALNPSLRVGDALNDVLSGHGQATAGHKVAEEYLRLVGLDRASAIAARFPHQISGGQRQRVSIASALCCGPSVVVLDEPTTGLDVATQAKILTELRRLCREQQVSMVYVTHDLAVVGEIADRIAVMYSGRVIEEGPTAQVLSRPRHPYTRGLLASIPDHVQPRVLEPMPGIVVGIGERPAGCAFAPRCPQRTDACLQGVPSAEAVAERHIVRCLHHARTLPVQSVRLQTKDFNTEAAAPVLEIRDLRTVHRSRGEVYVAAENISFKVRRGECVALVGESGSGKTTIARTVAGLHPLAGGQMLLHGTELASMARRRTREQRRQIQIVFQDPAAALNPQHTIFDTIARPAQLLRKLDHRALPDEVHRLLDAVRLPARVAERYPHQLSGGERQRVAIARALAADPEILLCDEITSALDVSVQAAILRLLRDLRDELGVGLLFITHDLGVVATIADSVLVLDRGAVVERGPTPSVLNAPQARYTQQLLGAAPSISALLGGGHG
jgi:peptide/nickel transport system ATP-binding protein